MGPDQQSFPDVALAAIVGDALLRSDQAISQIIVTDANRLTVWVNPAFTAVSGYTLEDMRGRSPGKVLQGPDTDPQTVKEIRRALAAEERITTEILNYTKEGRPYWSRLEILPIHDSEGRLLYFLGLQQDITSARRNLEHLELLQASINQVNDVVIITEAEPIDPPGPRIVYVNDAFERQTGYTREEAIGQTPRMLQSPLTNRATLDGLRRALQAWQPVTVELLNRKKNGEDFWTELSISPVADHKGWFTHWVSAQRDITARKSFERELNHTLAELRRANSLFEAAGRIAHIGQWQVFLDRRPPLWSENTYRIHGLEPGVPVTLDMAVAFYAPEYRDHIRECVRECIENRRPFEFEAILNRADGKPIWVKSTGEPLLDENGEFVAIHGIIQDIDRQKRALLALEDRERRLSSLSANVPGGLYQFCATQDGKYTFPFFSEAFSRILGLPPDADGSQIGKIIRERIPETEHALIRAKLKASQEHLTQFKLEFPYNHPELGLRWIRVSSTPTRGEDNSTTWHGYLEDVTDLKLIEEQLRKTAQQAEAANVAKSVFLSNMSHEIRTPLNAVIGMADLLATCPLDSEARSFVDTIQTSSRALLTLIDDILDFSKIDAGELTLAEEPTELLPFLEATLGIVAEAARQKSIELAMLADPGLPGRILVDPGRLRQVLLNLLSNAIKFTPKGFVTMTARPLTSPESEATQLQIRVTDSGIGIAPESFPKLFKRFSQVHDKVTRPYGGTGLGLAICQRLVQAMGGDISVESQLGAGSCFTVVLPLRPVEDDSQRSIQTVPARLQGRRAMLIHYQPTLRSLYGSMLESLGLSTLTVADIEEALQAMESGPRPELVVLDYIRPDFPVDAIVQRLRNVPGMESLPVLVFSSTGCPFCEGITARNGVVAKPVCRGDLVAQVTRLLEADSTPPGDALRTGSTGRFDFSSIPRPRDLRILIAEDNAVNRRVLSLMLEKLGYACDAVENGREAVEAVCNRTYDLVLMDIQMPVLDGIGATVEIRKRVAAVARPTIIALTANATKQDQMACFEAGMDGFISKPVQAADLLQVLTSVSVQTAQ